MTITYYYLADRDTGEPLYIVALDGATTVKLYLTESEAVEASMFYRDSYKVNFLVETKEIEFSHS